MRKRLRAWLCRILDAVPAENVQTPPPAPEPHDWSDLWEYKDHRPMWLRIYRSQEWSRDLEPYFKWCLFKKLWDLTWETDEKKRERLQIMCQLLDLFLNEPRMEYIVARDSFDQEYGPGEMDRLMKEQERANV